MAGDVKQVVTYLVEQLVDQPGQVRIQEGEQDGVMVLHLAVAEEDKGKIIGRQGKVIKAIRTLAMAAGSSSARRVAINLE